MLEHIITPSNWHDLDVTHQRLTLIATKCSAIVRIEIQIPNTPITGNRNRLHASGPVSDTLKNVQTNGIDWLRRGHRSNRA